MSAQRAARYRLAHHGSAPKSPNRFVNTFLTTYHNATPRKKSMLKQHFPSPQTWKMKLNLTNTLTSRLELLKRHDEKTKRKKLIYARIAKQAKAKKELKLSKCRLMDKVEKQEVSDDEEILHRKKRSDALPEETCNDIKKFLWDNSTSIANVKSVTKNLEERRVLNDSLANLHAKYNATAKNQVGLTTFKAQKGKNILCVGEGKLLKCRCDVCEGFVLLLEGIERFCKDKNIELEFPLDLYKLLEFMLCSVEDYSCCLGDCQRCGIEKLDLQPLLEFSEEFVKYETWAVENKKKVNVDVMDTVEEVCKKLVTNAKMMAVHKFDAQWQWTQFLACRENLEEEDVLMVMDYAQNYECTYQREIQSAHWGHNLVTIHPFAVFYLCPDDGHLVTHDISIISNDLEHDSHAVEVFTTKVLALLVEKGIPMARLYQYSDGCAAQ